MRLSFFGRNFLEKIVAAGIYQQNQSTNQSQKVPPFVSSSKKLDFNFEPTNQWPHYNSILHSTPYFHIYPSEIDSNLFQYFVLVYKYYQIMRNRDQYYYHIHLNFLRFLFSEAWWSYFAELLELCDCYCLLFLIEMDESKWGISYGCQLVYRGPLDHWCCIYCLAIFCSFQRIGGGGCHCECKVAWMQRRRAREWRWYFQWIIPA